MVCRWYPMVCRWYPHTRRSIHLPDASLRCSERASSAHQARPRPLRPERATPELQAVAEWLGRAHDTIHPDSEQVPVPDGLSLPPPKGGPTYYHGGTATVLTCDAHNRECTVLARVLFRNVGFARVGCRKSDYSRATMTLETSREQHCVIKQHTQGPTTTPKRKYPHPPVRAMAVLEASCFAIAPLKVHHGVHSRQNLSTVACFRPGRAC